MIDVLVTCSRHGDSVSLFPQVRGYYLARHLARASLRAEFRQLPLPGLECEVLICSEYQCEMDWFERHLAGPFGEIRADRWFCLVDASLYGRPDHFSYEVCRWFASRGGVLCHTADGELEPYEHWIGLGIDSDVVQPAADRRREHVLFDFPRSDTTDPAAIFDVETLDVLRQRLQGYRLIGSGAADATVREDFKTREMRLHVLPSVVAATGQSDGRSYGFTFSDLTQRLLPAIVLDAYPDSPVTPARAVEIAQSMIPTPPFKDGAA